MKHIRYTLALVLLLAATVAFGQKRAHNKNVFPVWTYHQDSINIHGVSLGLWSPIKTQHTNTNGIKVELIGIGLLILLAGNGPIVESDSAFEQILLENPLSERINGIAVSGLGTICQCTTNGLTVGGIAQYNYSANGVMVATHINMVQKMNGLMATFSINSAYKVNGLSIALNNYVQHANGAQIGFLGNKSKRVKGVQICTGKNQSERMTGVQIGAVNKATHLKGLQIGLWNVNSKRKLPLVNWDF
jgi:hypothetical protein